MNMHPGNSSVTIRKPNKYNWNIKWNPIFGKKKGVKGRITAHLKVGIEEVAF